MQQYSRSTEANAVLEELVDGGSEVLLEQRVVLGRERGVSGAVGLRGGCLLHPKHLLDVGNRCLQSLQKPDNWISRGGYNFIPTFSWARIESSAVTVVTPAAATPAASRPAPNPKRRAVVDVDMAAEQR